MDFQTRMGKRGQFGIMKIEDYSGSFEFMLFGDKYDNYKKYGDPGYAIVGWGVVDYKNSAFTTIAYGAITTKSGVAPERQA